MRTRRSSLSRRHNVMLGLAITFLCWASARKHSSTHQFTAATKSRRKWNLPAIKDQDSIANFVSCVSRGGQTNYDYYDDRGYSGGNYNNEGYSGDYYNPNNYDDDFDDGRYSDEDDQGYYDDRRSRVPSRGGRPSFNMPNIIKTGNRKIGVPLLGIGAALSVLGASLFFNKTLMRLGNLFFVAGIPMTIGPGRTASYFLQPKKARATGCLFLGIFLVFVGHPVLGILLEAFGLLNLFGNMFPVAFAVLKTMPVIGPLLKGQGLRSSSGSGRGSRYDDDYNDDYYDDRYYQDDLDPYYDDRNYYDDDQRGNDDDKNW